MFIPGLVSITFRKLTPEELIALCLKVGVQGIEWGGDVHVPAGDAVRAKEVGQLTRDAGLIVAAYGSYYRLGCGPDKNKATFEQTLASAAALGAPTIRVWAGGKGSKDTSSEERAAVVADALRCADLAAKRGITICLEYHSNTLTDDAGSVRTLMNELDHSNIEFLWQPSVNDDVETSTRRLIEVLPRLRNLHVFQWNPGVERRPLAEGGAAWSTYLDIVRETGKPVDCLLEFVMNDSTEQFVADAATLRKWLA